MLILKLLLLLFAIISALSVSSCKTDDAVSCTSCSSSETSSFEVCEENDGNASVNGQNTGTPYGTYILELENAGASCGN